MMILTAAIFSALQLAQAQAAAAVAIDPAPVPIFEFDPAPNAVSDLTAGEATETSLTLRWSAPYDPAPETALRTDGSAFAYDVRYSTVDPATTDSYSWWTNATPTAADDGMQPKIPGSTETLVVGGLSSGVAYYFAIESRDNVSADHWSALSNVAMGGTLLPPYVPPTPGPGSTEQSTERSGGNSCGNSAAGHAGGALLIAAILLLRGVRA